mmetsp:Transcript_17648/g.53380  ORF Transcript_17648/g.53380 Transcript_17648/m.53380 type:complete len:88 (+) Transcript_17648:325-588(+)
MVDEITYTEAMGEASLPLLLLLRLPRIDAGQFVGGGGLLDDAVASGAQLTTTLSILVLLVVVGLRELSGGVGHCMSRQSHATSSLAT